MEPGDPEFVCSFSDTLCVHISQNIRAEHENKYLHLLSCGGVKKKPTKNPTTRTDKIRMIKQALPPDKPAPLRIWSWSTAQSSIFFFLHHTPWEVMVIIALVYPALRRLRRGPQTVGWNCLPESFSRPPRVMIDDKLLWGRRHFSRAARRVAQTELPSAGKPYLLPKRCRKVEAGKVAVGGGEWKGKKKKKKRKKASRGLGGT